MMSNTTKSGKKTQTERACIKAGCYPQTMKNTLKTQEKMETKTQHKEGNKTVKNASPDFWEHPLHNREKL